MMLRWFEGSHFQLGVSQFSQCIHWYTLKYILQYKSLSNKQVVKKVWSSDGLRGPTSSLKSVSLVNVFSGIPWNIYYSIRVYQTSKVVKTVWCSDGLRSHIQLGVSQFSQCIQWYTLKYILQYKSVSNKQGCQQIISLTKCNISLALAALIHRREKPEGLVLETLATCCLLLCHWHPQGLNKFRIKSSQVKSSQN